MTQRVKHRMQSEAGETLVEVLAAILVSSLGMLILAGVIATAKNLNSISEDTANTYYTGISALARTADISSPGPGNTGSVQIKLNSLQDPEGNVIGNATPTDIYFNRQSLPGNITGIAYVRHMP